MAKAQQAVGWQIELMAKALDTVENIAIANGYVDDAISTSAIASVMASVIDQAYSIGLCIGAASKDDKGKRVVGRCFRNLN